MVAPVALGAGLSTAVLLALLDVAEVGVPGNVVVERLAAVGSAPRADKLLVALLRLEDTGHVVVDRGPDGMRFALTEQGRERAYELGGGKPVHLQLLMADLVGFTAFTVAHGDAAARAAAGMLHQVASDALRRSAGEVVKAMGDGFLAWLPASAEPAPVVAAVAAGCERPDGQPWQLRAASHVGQPIRHGGDLFGRDVNLVARLCAAAAPGQLVRSTGNGTPEHVALHGIEDPIAIWREDIS